MDAISFWDRFEGRWLRGSEFQDLSEGIADDEAGENWPKFDS
jgi:hypothetical protein